MLPGQPILGKGLKVLVIGGDIPIEEVEEEVRVARASVQKFIKSILPDAKVILRWGEVSCAEFSRPGVAGDSRG
jgi:hypothetical protein